MPLSKTMREADTLALHRDFDEGNLFLDPDGAQPIAGFLVTSEQSASSFDKATRSANRTFGLHTPRSLTTGTMVYQIEGGAHVGTWQILSPTEMDGASVYALRDTHRIT